MCEISEHLSCNSFIHLTIYEKLPPCSHSLTADVLADLGVPVYDMM